MGTITIRCQDGAQRTVASIEELKRRIDAATYAATVESGRTLQSDIRGSFAGAHPPGFPHIGGSEPNVASGALQNSIARSATLPIGRAKYGVDVSTDLEYSRAIEFGATIFPLRAQYLSWFSPWLGRRIFRHSVHLEGWPYFRPGIAKTAAKLRDIYHRYWLGAILG